MRTLKELYLLYFSQIKLVLYSFSSSEIEQATRGTEWGFFFFYRSQHHVLSSLDRKLKTVARNCTNPILHNTI